MPLLFWAANGPEGKKLVHLRAQDFDRFSLDSVLKYWWQWPDGTLSHSDAGNASFDLLTIYDSVWKSNRVEVFGHDFQTDSDMVLTSGTINRIDISEGLQISPFLPAGDYSLSLSLNGLSLDTRALRTVADSIDTQDDFAQIVSIFSGNDLLTLKGDNRVSAFAGNDKIICGAGNDRLKGGWGNDTIQAGAGDDAVFLDRGNDVLWGGAGTDSLIVAAGPGARIDLDRETAQRTGWGSDSIVGFENIYGNDGADRFFGNALANIMVGNNGQDLLNGRGGNDTLRGGIGHDRISGGAGDDDLFGSKGGDILTGGDGDDRLYGGAGNDTLTGGRGWDNLYGGAGDDTIYAGTGNKSDGLHGGQGADVFVFRTLGSADIGYADTIMDFRHGQDRIDLSHIDADTKSPGHDSFRFVPGDVLPTAPGGQISVRHVSLYDVKHTVVQIDIDGDSEAEMVIDIIGKVTVTEGDFIF